MLAGNTASQLYQLALDNADAEYDFEVALAELLRTAAEEAADSSYDQQKVTAEASYKLAIEQAQVDFLSALSLLPEADRATYDLSDFSWPDTPDANALQLPSGSSQPRPSQAPTYSGAAFDPAKDPSFRSAVAQAERAYFESVRSAQQQYEQEVKAVKETYQDEVEAAQEIFEDATHQASEDYNTTRQNSNNPTFDDTTFQGYLEDIKEAWEEYRDAIRGNNERHRVTDENAAEKRTAALVQVGLNQSEAKTQAYEDAYDEWCEDPPFGNVFHEIVELRCNAAGGEQNTKHYSCEYEGEEKHDRTRSDSPSENRSHEKALYQINKRFANRRKDIQNSYTETVQNSLKKRDVANANALKSALVKVYDAHRNMAHLSRDFRHDALVDGLNDTQQFTVAMASARNQLQQALADAESNRAKGVADKVHDRDDAIAVSQRNRDQSVASARLSATQYWAQNVGTFWSVYQWDLATNANDYTQQVAEEALVRDQAKNDAVYEETYVVADAKKQRTIDVAAADHTRTVELADALRTFQVDVDATYTTRDKSLADKWRDYRADFSEALKTHRVDLAEINATYNIKDGESSQKEQAILSWAHDIHVADWYGIQWYYELDNSARRENARRTRDREAAEITRDRALDQVDANETLDLDRIRAVEDYRKDTAGVINIAAKEVAEHLFTYQTEVASIQDDYHVAVVTAAVTYTVEETRGEALNEYQTIQADSRFDAAESPLSKTRNVADATSQKTYEISEANNYLSLVSAWATTVPARWGTYQVGLAEAERDRVTSVGNARVTRTTNTGNASISWTQTVATADITYAAAMYGGVSGGGALVQRAQTIATGHVTNAENGSLVTYVTDQATAVKIHDQGVADKNQIFYDALATADATRDREASKASHNYDRAVARANYQWSKPDGISSVDRNERVAEAGERRIARVARANEKRSIAAAEARRSWTAEVGKLNVEFVEDLVAAQNDQADVLRTETIILATAVATGQSTYLAREAWADGQRTVDIAGADSTYEKSVAGTEATYAVRLDAALSVKSEADAKALGNYEVGLYVDHASTMTNQHGITDTNLSLYRKLVADADHIWSQAKANARNLFHQSLSLFEATRISSITGADVAHTARSTAASQAYSSQKAGADSSLLAKLASDDAILYIAQQTAQADLTVSATESQGAADIAYAEAVRDRNDAYADANVEWVKTTASAYVSYKVGDITWSRYQEIFTEANEQRDEAKQAGDETFQRAMDDAGAEEVQELGAARIVYVDTVGAAKTTQVEASNSATEYNAVQSAQYDNQLTSSLANSNETHQNQLLVADHTHTVSTGSQDVIYETRLRDAGTTLAASHGTAEAQYQLTEAQTNSVYWASEASTYPNDDYVRFRAAESATQEAWFTALVAPFSTFKAMVALAAGQVDVDLTSVRVSRESSRSAATVLHDRKIIAQERRRTIELTVADNTSAVVSVRNENSTLGAVAGAEHSHALNYVNAKVDYDVSVDAIERNDEISSDERDDQIDQARYERDVAFADGELDWRAKTSQAEYNFAAAEARKEYLNLTQQAAAEAFHGTQIGNAAADRDIAFAQAEATSWLAETVAENVERESRALAGANFQTAQYAAKTNALDELVEGLPRVSGQLDGIEAGFASSDLVFQANQFGAGFNSGEFKITGSSFTKHAGAGGETIAIGPINNGIAARDNATGTGYIMFSAESVHTRFSAHAPYPSNSDHLIAVQYDSGQWYYDNNGALYPFSPLASDHLLATVDFSADTIQEFDSTNGIGGNLPWAEFEKDRAAAEEAAWANVKGDYLQWQTDVSTARNAYQTTRANERISSATDMATASRTYSTTVAGHVESRLGETAETQRNYALGVADLTTGYRAELAQAKHQYSKGLAQAHRDNTSTYSVNSQYNSRQQDAEDVFQTQGAQLVDQREGTSAATHSNYIGNEANSRISRTVAIRDAELDFVNTVADAYFNPSGSNGLEQQLAQLDSDYAALEAVAMGASLSTLATTSNTPWASYAKDAYVAAENNLSSATRLLDQQRRLAKAEAARDWAIRLTEAERELAIRSIQAEASLDIQIAQANGLAVTYSSISDGDIDLPLDVSPPTPDLGEIHIVSTSYAVAQPGSIGDGWYRSYLGSYDWYYGWNYDWNSYQSYYWGDYGQYDYGWGYDGFAGAYGGWGYYYGGWGYGLGAYGWGGWSPSYVSTPTAATSDHAIDIESAVANNEAQVDALTAPVKTTTNGLADSEQHGISQINIVDGDVNPNSTGGNSSSPPQAQTLAASVKVLADESTGFTWEGTFEEYLKEYGDEGLALYAFVTRQGWEIRKGSYSYFSTRQDWWLDEEEKILYIGDTDWGGTAYRSNGNAAVQMYYGLFGVIAHEDFLKEIDLIIGEDWAELGWYEASRRMGAAVLFNSIFTGIKSVENALEGETVTGNKIEGWDRLKLGAFGTLETLLVVVPLAKSAVAVGGKLGLGGLATASVRKAMAADILRGFGVKFTRKLAASHVGQGFVRAYAKVYNSKYNKALVGTTKQEIKVGGTGAAAATPDEAAIAQARQRATNTKRVSTNVKTVAATRPAQRIYRTFDDFRVGRKFADLDEALKGWEVYQRAAKSNGLIIGKTKEITKYAGQEGRDILYFYRRASDGTKLARSGWTWEINKSWLDGAIDQGLTVKILTPATELAKSGALWREFNYLLSKGYKISNSLMVPPIL